MASGDLGVRKESRVLLGGSRERRLTDTRATQPGPPPVTPHTASITKGRNLTEHSMRKKAFRKEREKEEYLEEGRKEGEEKTGSADLERQSGSQIVKSCEGAQLGLFKAKGGGF